MNDSAPEKDLGKPPPLWFLRIYTRINVLVYRLSGGRLMNKSVDDEPICLVTMTGAKSGKRRTIPLMYVPHGDTVILVGSQGGNPKNPVWVYNLRVNPEVVVEQGGVKRSLIARQVDSEEKAQLWPICVQYYPPYDIYQQRTTRDIPVFICEPPK